jgi:predicted TPR repeat methyltransferase
MSKYQIIATEVVKYIVTVEADSEAHARAMVMDGEVDFSIENIVDGWDFQISHITKEWE